MIRCAPVHQHTNTMLPHHWRQSLVYCVLNIRKKSDNRMSYLGPLSLALLVSHLGCFSACVGSGASVEREYLVGMMLIFGVWLFVVIVSTFTADRGPSRVSFLLAMFGVAGFATLVEFHFQNGSLFFDRDGE